jgi:hypothetical protein
MGINCHKINSSIQINKFWVPKPLFGYFEMTLHVGIAFRVGFSPKDYFKMNLHAGITTKL